VINLNVFSFFDKYTLYQNNVQIHCNEGINSCFQVLYEKCATQIVFFIQITCLGKGQIKKHFLIKLQWIDKTKEGSVSSTHHFSFHED